MAFGKMDFSGFLSSAYKMLGGGTVFDKLYSVANTVASNSSVVDQNELDQTLVVAVANYTTSDYSIYNEYVSNSYSGTKSMAAELSAVAQDVMQLEKDFAEAEAAEREAEAQAQERARVAAEEKQRELEAKKKDGQAEGDDAHDSDDASASITDASSDDEAQDTGNSDEENAGSALLAALAAHGVVPTMPAESKANSEDTSEAQGKRSGAPEEEVGAVEPTVAPAPKKVTREALLRSMLLRMFYPSITDLSVARLGAFYDGEEMPPDPDEIAPENVAERAADEGDVFESSAPPEKASGEEHPATND